MWQIGNITFCFGKPVKNKKNEPKWSEGERICTILRSGHILQKPGGKS